MHMTDNRIDVFGRKDYESPSMQLTVLDLEKSFTQTTTGDETPGGTVHDWIWGD